MERKTRASKEEIAERKKDVINYITEGFTIADTAKKLNINQSLVSKQIKGTKIHEMAKKNLKRKLDNRLTQTKKVQENKEYIIESVKNGKTLLEISKELGIHRGIGFTELMKEAKLEQVVFNNMREHNRRLKIESGRNER